MAKVNSKFVILLDVNQALPTEKLDAVMRTGISAKAAVEELNHCCLLWRFQRERMKPINVIEERLCLEI